MKFASNLTSSVTLNKVITALLVVTLLFAWLVKPGPALAQGDDPGPPSETVKLIFIHHSCGENWLVDGYGNLGRTLGENNYFVSDTNYGWGPGSIGDATDIVDWPSWFGPHRDEHILSALYNESGQNSYEYTRTLSDPGGENTIIMFKSCYPNSNLEGSPSDGPDPSGYDYSVGSAKFIYNELLDYFSSRPDKLFVVITAPPVQDPSLADNARAFNTWLVQDWLDGYSGSNVAVFDFYNVLTAPKNHHRFHNGAVEYVTNSGGNTLYYPSNGDDHPSVAGSQKATDEFVPLLNVYYHRWQAGASAEPPPESAAPPSEGAEEVPFEGAEQPAEPAVSEGPSQDLNVTSENWEPGVGEGSTASCVPDTTMFKTEPGSLRIEYSVPVDSWGACGRSFETARDWSSGDGISMVYQSEKEDQQMLFTIFSGPSDGRTPFEFYFDTTAESTKDWVQLEMSWDEFERADWADPGGPAELDPKQVLGFGITVINEENSSEGNIWIDRIYLGRGEIPETSEQAEPAAPSGVEAEGEDGRPCPCSSMLLPVGAVVVGLLLRKRESE